MEKYRHDLGFYCSKEPLSLTAGKILSVLQPIPADQSCKNATRDRNVCTGKHHLEFKHIEVCHEIGLKYKENVSVTRDLSEDHCWNASLEDHTQLAHFDTRGSPALQNEFQINAPSNKFFFSEDDDDVDEQASCSKQCSISTIPKKPALALSHISPRVLPGSKITRKDIEPSKNILIPEKKDGQAQSATAVFNTTSHKTTGHLSPSTSILKCQPSQKPKLCSPEHNVRGAFIEKKDKVFKRTEMKLYDMESIRQEQQITLLTDVRQAKAFAFTIVFHNGLSQLSASKDPTPILQGILVLVKKDNVLTSAADTDGEDTYFYLPLVDEASWRKDQKQRDFIRTLLPYLFQSQVPGICFNAKEFLRSVIPIFREILSLETVLQSVVLDPRIAAWLLNPVDSSPTFEDLVKKYCDKIETETADPSTDQQDTCKRLNLLYSLMERLRCKLQADGLWNLFYTIELPLTAILAVMENQPIQVNKEELKKTSALLGSHLKDLEQEAHLAAGEKFRLTSSKELREVLYEKFRLHLQCKVKLPQTNLCRFPSTAEPALHLLKDLHPLPKIILQFRQIQKIKSTFIDGLSAYMTKGCVTPTWNQTGTVSGRLSAKHPNIQGVSKLSVQFEKKQKVPGKDKEIITVNPRSVFISAARHTFLAADFSQIELRLLAHFSSDSELLKLFHEAEETDIFTNLASQWKSIDYRNVTQTEREQAKRIVYSVIYGVGKERLSECLGTTPTEANAFMESFLQKYRVSDFTQRVVQECRTTGRVVSLMGRKRSLPHINSRSYSLRAQAERQAVNFVIQGSAADLCKLAMIKISSCIITSSNLTARLIAQIHDELMFEVDDSQMMKFAELVKHTMESLQHEDGVKLKVPLKVTLTSGKSWGCMTELQVK
ncbi:DNA polymerase nu [Hyperolius riggenbachi]|uniref:DNA polymerase nu n=1 Tax=Hyperolius riggenbachi TaxID=752182 RepID=UPI0035A27F69